MPAPQVGDAYISAFNLVRRDDDHPLSSIRMGCAIVRVVSCMYVRIPGEDPIRLSARVGVHCGPAAGGILGTKRSVLQLVGDTLVSETTMLSCPGLKSL